MTEITFFKQLEDAVDPIRATEGSAAFDISTPSEITICPRQIRMIDTGIIFNIPKGWTGLLFARSGLAAKKGISLATGVSLIDSDFRETLKVPLQMRPNSVLSPIEPVLLPAGARIAQIVFLKLDEVGLSRVFVKETTDRGGFGSTGV